MAAWESSQVFLDSTIDDELEFTFEEDEQPPVHITVPEINYHPWDEAVAVLADEMTDLNGFFRQNQMNLLDQLEDIGESMLENSHFLNSLRGAASLPRVLQDEHFTETRRTLDIRLNVAAETVLQISDAMDRVGEIASELPAAYETDHSNVHFENLELGEVVDYENFLAQRMREALPMIQDLQNNVRIWESDVADEETQVSMAQERMAAAERTLDDLLSSASSFEARVEATVEFYLERLRFFDALVNYFPMFFFYRSRLFFAESSELAVRLGREFQRDVQNFLEGHNRAEESVRHAAFQRIFEATSSLREEDQRFLAEQQDQLGHVNAAYEQMLDEALSLCDRANRNDRLGAHQAERCSAVYDSDNGAAAAECRDLDGQPTHYQPAHDDQDVSELSARLNEILEIDAADVRIRHPERVARVMLLPSALQEIRVNHPTRPSSFSDFRSRNRISSRPQSLSELRERLSEPIAPAVGPTAQPDNADTRRKSKDSCPHKRSSQCK